MMPAPHGAGIVIRAALSAMPAWTYGSSASSELGQPTTVTRGEYRPAAAGRAIACWVKDYLSWEFV